MRLKMRRKIWGAAVGVAILVGAFGVQASSAIVVGGGLAGLTAAFELQKKGWQVTLLEAGPKVGGRQSLAEVEWIGSVQTAPQMNAYIDQFKLKTQPIPSDAKFTGFMINGQFSTMQDIARRDPQVAASIKKFDAAYIELSNQIGDPANPVTEGSKSLDNSNVSQWINKLSLHPAAKAVIEQRIRVRYEEPQRLSLLYFAQQGKVYGELWADSRRDKQLAGGETAMIEAFAKSIKTIKTNTKVTSITQDANGVVVKAGSESLKADYALVTVALPALEKIQMSPALPDQQQSAIRALNYAWRDQILMKFKKPTWGKERISGDIYTDKGLGMIWIEPQGKKGAALLLNIGGDNARLVKPFGERQVMEQFLLRLEDKYKGSREQLSGYEVRRYETNPLFGGAYVAYTPGKMTKYWKVWEKPAGRVFFAGEHTDTLYPGTYEGAIRSGQRAVNQLQDLSSGKSQK